MSNIALRSPFPADFDAWQALWLGYQAFYCTEIPSEVSRVTWQRLLDPAEPMHCTLAVEDGKPIGLVHHIFHRSCWTVGNYCYLQDLFVEPGHRARGVGRRLIDHVYAAARAAGCSRVWWLTHETNRDAMHLYDRIAERSGFVQYRKIL